ncbi:pimeloyl-ACP methyl ester carboxylesterase [Haloferula luteola]|uniref:Pimeloyl-ACP methyl ester carboxylesterase n=1 Tax=Haloferula luteola TaxID=595692 RepID=A0A840V0F2_9BACT|nr:alpha/beta fold hydrolase [Haloferula luteola]MBB5351482.1 pimeloyl-ACP methyl ester carboxylesterase [Haloferula luteola]
MIEKIDFRNRQGEKLDTVFHPGEREEKLVIIGHGVTANLDRPLLKAIADGLAQKGWPCLRLSFSGNGKSEGDFRESNITKESEDLADVIELIPDEVEIAYVGHSMGGAVGIMAAAEEERIKVLTTLAGMVHTAEFVEREFGEVTPDEGCMWDEKDCPLSAEFVRDLELIGDMLLEIERIEAPYLLIHGTADDVVPPSDSEDALESAADPKHAVWIEGAGHMFSEESYEEIVDAINDWFEEHFE